MDYPDPLTSLEVSVTFSRQVLTSSNPPLLMDCREQSEFDYCRISGAILIPLSDFQERAAALLHSADTFVIIYCHHGVRSLHATQYLRSLGFQNTYSMAHGIDAWSVDIDASVPRY